MLPFKFDELFEAGCIQTGADSFNTLSEAQVKFAGYFLHIMGLTNHDPCKECPALEGCAAHKKYHSSQVSKKQRSEAHRLAATTAPGGESVAKIAERLGLSKNEVRRRKQARTL